MTNLQFSDQEIWKDIFNYEGLYLISSFGRIKALSKIIYGFRGASRRMPDLFLKPHTNKNGYVYVLLTDGNKKRKSYLLHRLVAMVFIKDYFKGATVNHLDGVKTNNNVSNLEWATQSQNNHHAIRTGLHIPIKGLKHYCCKKLLDKKTGKIYGSVSEAALAMGLKFATVYYMAKLSKSDFGLRIIS